MAGQGSCYSAASRAPGIKATVIFVLFDGVDTNGILQHEECTEELSAVLKTRMYLCTTQKLFWDVLQYKMPIPVGDYVAMEDHIELI